MSHNVTLIVSFSFSFTGDGSQSLTVSHPAMLAPLTASRDVCLRVLAMVRTLLRSDGQALLLRDPSGGESTTSAAGIDGRREEGGVFAQVNPSTNITEVCVSSQGKMVQ